MTSVLFEVIEEGSRNTICRFPIRKDAEKFIDSRFRSDDTDYYIGTCTHRVEPAYVAKVEEEADTFNLDDLLISIAARSSTNNIMNIGFEDDDLFIRPKTKR